MGDIFYYIQGVPLTDNRWEGSPTLSPDGRQLTGVWEPLRDISLLPQLPGFKVTRFERPGQHGESQAQYAPIAPNGFPISVRVYAIESDPARPDFRQVPTTPGARLDVLERNVGQFLFRTQIGASGAKGYLEVERRLGVNGDPRYASGRFITSSTPSHERSYRWADYHFIFENPFGTWYGDEITIDQTLTTSETEILVPMGTAPVWDAMVAARPTGPNPFPAGSRFTNDMDIGFEMSRQSGNNHWWIMHTLSRTASVAGSASWPNWAANLDNVRMVAEFGRPQGSALTINPGVADTPDQVGMVKVRLTSPGQVRIRYRPRYF